MTTLKKFSTAAAACVLLAGAARAQQPVRAVYVTGQDGNSKIFHVTGTVPPEKIPTVAPAAPTNLPSLSVRTTARHDDPAPVADAAPIEDATCATGHCGPRCKHGPTSFWVCAHTPATVPAPLGASVRGVFDMQRDNALAEYFVIHREDWHDSMTMLNHTGMRHIDGVIRRFGIIGSPVKVEPTGIGPLDQKRVAAIVEKLVDAGVPPQEAHNRVVLGTSRAEGLRNGDIESIFNRGGLGGSGLGGTSGLGSFSGYGVGGFGGIGGIGIR